MTPEQLHEARTTLTLLMVIHGNRHDPESREWALDILKGDGARDTDEAQAAIARRVLRLARALR